jgi:hypothetical protein
MPVGAGRRAPRTKASTTVSATHHDMLRYGWRVMAQSPIKYGLSTHEDSADDAGQHAVSKRANSRGKSADRPLTRHGPGRMPSQRLSPCYSCYTTLATLGRRPKRQRHPPHAGRLASRITTARPRSAGHGNNTGRKFGLQLLLRHHTALRTRGGSSRISTSDAALRRYRAYPR